MMASVINKNYKDHALHLPEKLAICHGKETPLEDTNLEMFDVCKPFLISQYNCYFNPHIIT